MREARCWCSLPIFRGGSRTAATSKMEDFVIIVNDFQLLTIIAKCSILYVAAVVDRSVYVYLKTLNFKAQLGVTTQKNFPKGVRYDYSYLPAQDVINRRLCSVCDLYLASIKEMSSQKEVQKNPQTNENNPLPLSEPRRLYLKLRLFNQWIRSSRVPGAALEQE